MSRRTDALVLFDALSIEGALLPAEWLARVAKLDAPAQKPADYGVPKGLELRDEITRYWRIAEALWADFVAARAAAGDDAEAPTTAFISQLLAQVFGFTDLRAAGRREAGGREFRITLEALGGRVPVVVGVPAEELEAPVARHGEGRRRSAWDTLQEYLNASDGALWGIAANGLRLRIGRDNSSLTRPAWIEADLERIFDEERFADFSVLWLLLHASRFGRPGAPPNECPLETWREKAREAGTRARDNLRDGVEAALLALGTGFLAHPANTTLRQALAAGELSPEDYFNELLRLVYRMIFLLTVEERGILHGGEVAPETRALYDEGYGMRRLRERALRRSQYDRHGDLWASLQPVFTALGRAGGEPALGLPELGGLFAADQCPHLDACTLENRALLDAVFRLAWLREDSGLARVNWKDMGPEELGSIYESLLELVPRIADGGRDFYFEGAAGNARKTTGSYYTPDELVQQLLDTALDPVVDQRLAEHPEDPEGALLGITVLDPACGSGHFLLAAARRLAARLAGIRAGGAPGAHEYRIALRDVITHCIFGVDRNPMALELARMSLWLESYTPDRALGFLDHHLVLGDSLLGLLDLAVLADGIPDDAFKALTGDDPDAVKVLRKVNRDARKALKELRKSENLALELGTEALEDAFARLDELSDDAIEDVEAKRARYEELRRQAETSGIALAADLYVGAFLMPKRLAPGEEALTERAAVDRFPQTGTLRAALDGTLRPEHPVVKAARKVCRDANVLHWPLAFPRVFARGGFDVVVGNPPWGAAIDPKAKLFLRQHFAVAADRLDSFAAFLELSVRVLRRRGALGVVVPDILLLKAYPATRKLLLETVSDLQLHAWGLAFEGVTMEAVTVSGRLSEHATSEPVRAAVQDANGEWQVRTVPREVYWRDKLLRFNLYFDPERENLRQRLDARSRRFGDLFTIREGVHSGNVRSRLFLRNPVNDRCAPLLRSGSEVQPMRVEWEGWYVDLGLRKTPGTYFNVGRPEYFAPNTILVRRTGDRVIAAVNVRGVYASNNFFTCSLRPGADCDPFWAAFVLNSPVVTWYFRYTQPREGKVFSELKIVHLEDFPIPAQPEGWRVGVCRVGDWGAVYEAYGLSAADVDMVRSVLNK